MKNKKIIFMFLALLFFSMPIGIVSAQKITCRYEKYKLEFEVSGQQVEFLQAYEDGKKIEAVVNDNIKPKKRSECPKKIYIKEQRYGNYAKEFYKEEQTENHKPYNLVSNKVYCGSEEQGRVTGIPKKIPELTSFAVTVIQIAIPVILVLMGTLDLFKGITAGKEDEIKKGQQMFIKRLIVGAVIFFVVIIVKFFISVIADTNQTNIVDCIDCFIDNDCREE